MAGGGETSVEANPRRRPALARARAWQLAVATLLLVAGLFGLWQAWLIRAHVQTQADLKTAQQEIRHTVERHLRVQREAVLGALIDPRLRADLAMATPEGRQAAQIRARQLLPDTASVEFYSPDLDEVVHADYGRFGYAKASRLMRLPDASGSPQFTVSLHAHGHLLALAVPVRDASGQLLAGAWLDWPLSVLEKIVMQAHPGTGRVGLWLSASPGGLLLFSHGGTDEHATTPMDGLPVSGSMLWIGAAAPTQPILLSLHPWFVLLLAIFALAASGILWWPRLRWHRSGVRSSPSIEEIALSAKTTPAAAGPAADAPATSASAPGKRPATTSAPRSVAVDPNIFRAYDIRGVVGTQLTAEVARALGQAIGEAMADKQLGEIVVGRDGRLSGPELTGALSDGLRAAGVDVIDVGAVPTPVIYYAAHDLGTGSCVAVTGSHNPPDYNGFKIVIGGETLSEDAIQDLYRRIVAGSRTGERAGGLRQTDVADSYIERIASDVQAERRLKVVADSGNGITGDMAPRLLEAIGCEVVPLFCEVDGQFPNHHPDPSDPRNLEDLIEAVKATGADLGVAFDGDGDRLGVVTREGEIIFPDRVLALFARDVLSRVPGATIIYDVKCTGHLGPEILKAGGSPLMWRTGHSLIKAKMRETEAQLAGEMSGHFFFRERWYGFDDGMYSATRLLEILASDPEGRSAEEIFATVPKGVSTPELKITMQEGQNHPFIARFQQQARFEGARLTTIDGVRADWADGWGLVRASNTTPVLVLRFDAESEAALERIEQEFREQLLAMDPDLELPF